MISTVELSRFIRDLNRAARDTPEAFKRMQRSVGKRHFELLSQFAPPDDEGRLRASLEKRSAGFGREFVEKYNKNQMEIGTKVYYASMVNDGHIVGKRIGNTAHRATDYLDRMSAAKNAGRAWVSGRFFREKAEDAIETEMDHFADEFAQDALREVMR